MKPNQIALALLAAVVGIGALLSVIISQNPVTHIATVAPQTQVAQVVQSITMGETNSTLSQQDDNGDANSLIAVQTSLSQTATIQSLSFYVTTASGKLRLGIYDATGSGGGPGAKVAETNEITPVKGWNMASVVTPRSLNAGTYWITYLTNDNNLYFPWSTSGSYRSAGVTYGAMPATYPSSARSGSGHAALYATLNFTTTPSNTGTPSTPAAPTYPPQISGVAVPTVTPTSATITWSTNIPADTQVYYGTTDAKFDYARYSSHTNLDTTLSTSHSVTLTGLIANTMYFFQVRSSANSKTGTIAQQFTTSPANTTVTPTINTFTISPSPAVRGQQATLSWTTTGLVSCTIESTGNTYIQQIFGSTLGVVKLPNDNITVNIPASVGILNRGTTSTVQLGCYTEPFTLDGAGHISKVNGTYIYKTVSVTIPAASTVVGDVLPPSVPTNLRVTSVTSSQVNLSWDASTDNAGGTGLQGYQIYRNGSFYTNTNTTTTFLNTSLNASTLYTYTVAAYDNATPTNVSAQSSSVSTTTPRAVDIGNPSVTAFTIPATSNSLTISPISITATDDTGVAGYMITTTAGAPLSTASGWTTTAPTSYTVAAAGASTLYAWAKDAAGNVSLSRSASVTVTLTSTPTATLSANPTTITSGNSSTLTWSSTNATSCTGTGGTFAGTKATSGTTSVSPTVTTTYGISCTGTGGTSATVNATVTVGTQPAGNSFYVVPSNTTGLSTPNNGSDWNHAYLGLPATLQRGATYYIADGAYGSYTFDDAVSGTQVITVKKATVADHGTVTGWVDTYGDGQAVFSGASGTLFQFATSNYVFDGSVRNETNWKDGTSYGFKMNIANPQGAQFFLIEDAMNVAQNNITINHVYAYYSEVYYTHNGNDGYTNKVIVNGQNINLRNSFIQNTSWHSVISTNFSTGFTVENNYFNNIFNKELIATEGTNNVIFRNNYVENVAGTGAIGFPNVSNWQIYNNVFWSPDSRYTFTDGIITTLVGKGQSTNNVKIYSNTFYKMNGAIRIGSDGGTGNEVKNNLFIGFTPSLSNFAGSNNINNANTSTVVNAATGDFHLSGPTIAGATLASPYNVDMDGKTRGTDGTWDIGAYEYTGTVTPTTYTLTATAGSNGTITPSSATVSSGTNQSFTITPNSGYKVNTVTDNGTSISTVPTAGGTYTVSNITANHTISATFSVASTKFTTNQQVQANTTVNVRSTAGNTTSLGTQALNAIGSVIGGPVAALLNSVSYIWWNINFTSGVDGWVAEDGLDAYTAPSTPTATLSANPTTITSGNSSTLTWSSTNATSCTGTGGTFAGTKATSGTTSVSPTVTTTYGISCTGTGGTSATMNATVTVGTVGTTYTWYVDSTATGSNNGTSWANAWTSLSSASGASVVAGDIVYISGGPAGSTRTYSGAWTPKSGTSSGRITYQIGQDSQHNGTAIFSGSGTWLTNPAYVNIIGDAGDGNMHFQTSGYSMILSADSSASQSYRIGYTNFGTMTSGNYGRLVQVSAGSNVEFDHNWLKSSAGAGSDIVFYWTAPGSAAYDSALKFHHNTLYAPFSSQGLGQDGMRIDGVSGVSIYNNLFSGYSYSGSTEHQDGIQDWTYGSYIKIYNNTFLDFANAGINISAYYGGYSHVRIYNNIISFTNSVASAGSEGGFIGIAAGGFTMNDCIVANNLIAGGSQGWSMNDSGNYGATWTNSLIENNISVQGAGVQADTAHGVVSSNNIDNMSLSTAQSYFTNYVSTLNGTNNNFHLKSGATNLIGKGTNLTSYGITTDFDGNPRPATGAWDIGPFQYTGSVTPTTYTLTATAGSNGTISPSGATTVASGGGQTYTINPSAGFQVASVLVDSVSVGAVTTYTFTNVVANHTISATFSAVVSTGNWYVKPNGTGGGTSWTDAASVTSIWSKNIQPGNTIWLAGGTTYTSGLTVSKSGNANSRIYVKRVRASDAVAVASPGWSSGYDSQVVFSLSSGDTIQINGSYVTVDGQVANGIKVNVPNVSGTPDGVAFSGTTGSVIANAEMSGPGMTASFAGYVEGLASYSGNGNMATNVYIHGFNQNISLYNDNGFVFDHCRIADNGSANVDTGHPNLIEYNSSRNMVMRYSVVENWTVVGLMMWNGGNGVSGAVTLYGNVFKNASQDLIWASGTGGANKGPVYLYNNTFINTAVSMGRENTVVLDTASRARNNIYWNISLWCGPWYATPGITNAGIIVDRDYEFASSATQAGNPSGGHNILNGSNPFVNYNGGDYHIVGTVGATYPKDKGVAVTNASGQTYDVDPDGTTRPSGAWDIGAYEYH